MVVKQSSCTSNIALGYNLETRYLFYNYRDNGQSDRWGEPDGGAGSFITGDTESRCAQWPPKGDGDPYNHTTISKMENSNDT